MADNNEVVPETKPDDVVVEVNDTNKVDETESEKKDDRSLFAKAFDKLFPPKKDDAADVDENNAEDVDETLSANEDEEIEIEDELYEVAKAKGWDDEKIAKYYQEDKSVLEALVAPKPEQSKSAEVPAKKEVEEVKSLENISIDPESMKALEDQYGQEVISKVVIPLMTKLNQTIDIVNTQSTKSKQVEEHISKQVMNQQVQSFQKEMDRLGKEYEVFGTWENVPRGTDGLVDKNDPVLKVREEVWTTARKFQQLGSDWTTAVEDAVALYKGKNLEKLTQSKIIKDLDKRKVKFTPRPTSKKVEAALPSGDAAKIAVINKGLKVIGKE
jgi:hypothetical protein